MDIFGSISHRQNPQRCQLLPELKWSSQREISENLLLVVVRRKKKKGFPESWWPASLIYSASTKRWYSEECCQNNTALRLRETHHLIFLVDVQEVIYLWKEIWQELLKIKIKISDLCSCCIVIEWKGERQTQNTALNRPPQNPTWGMRH